MGIAYGEWKSFGDNVVNILWISEPKVVDVLNCTGYVLGRAPRTKETLPEFFQIKYPWLFMDFISALIV